MAEERVTYHGCGVAMKWTSDGAKTLPASCSWFVTERPPFAHIFGLITQV